jgi:hypothetical protein
MPTLSVFQLHCDVSTVEIGKAKKIIIYYLPSKSALKITVSFICK